MADHRGIQPGQSKIDAEARDWVTREKLGVLSSRERAEVKLWRARSEAHEAEFQNALRIWALAGTAARQFNLDEPAPLSRRRLLQGGALVAGAAGMAHAASWVGIVPRWQSVIADHATGRGEQRSIVLSDRVTADLDGDTAINVDANARRLDLVRGAAVISVADGGPIVTVSAGPGKIALSAGISSAHLSGETVQVGCLQGAASVVCGTQTALEPGQVVTYSAKGLGAKSEARLEDIAAWRRGYLVFRARPLRDVVADLNRHRPGRIVLTDDGLGQRRVSGTFRLDGLGEVLSHLTAAFSLKATELPGGIVFLS